MEACQSALAALRARFLSPLSDTKATTALWEAACRWEDSVKRLQPLQEYKQLLRAAADLASLLAPTLARTASAAEASEAADNSRTVDASSVSPQRTRANIAAAVAKAADGMTELLSRQSAAADPALLQRMADGIAAAVLCYSMPAAVGQDIRQLEAVTGLATKLLRLGVKAKNSAPPVHRAMALAVSRPGRVGGLLRGTLECLHSIPGSKSSARRTDTLFHTTTSTLSLMETLLSNELDRVAADGQLVQQLLRLVVLPFFAHLLQHRTSMLNKLLWDSILAGILNFLRADPIRPYARNLLARGAPPVGSVAWTQDIPAAVAAAAPAPAPAPAEAHGTATLGGNLVHLLMKVLGEQRMLWHQGRKAAERKSEHSAPQRQHKGSIPGTAQAAAVANLGCLLPQLMQLLPCALDSEQAQALASDYFHRLGSGTANGTSIGGLCQASTLLTVQPATPDWAGRAAEAAFLQGVQAVVAALLDLKDSGGVPQLVCSMDDLPQSEPGEQDAEWDAAVAVCCLGDSLTAFQCWADGTLEPSDVRWVPSDLAATCAAAEALMRLAPQMQQGQRGVRAGSQRAPRNLHWVAGRWLEAVQLSVNARNGQQQQQQQQQQLGAYTSEAASAGALTSAQVRAAILPAIHAATTAVKLAHASRSMPAAQKGVLFDSQVMMIMTTGSCVLTAGSVVSSLWRQAYPRSEPEEVPLDIKRKVDAMVVSILDVAGILAKDAAPLVVDAAAAASEGHEAMMKVLLGLTRFAVNTNLPGKPAAMLLAPAAMEAGLRLLLARIEPTKVDLESYRFWIYAGKTLLEDPRLCAKVVGSGVLADSAAWLARQLEQGQLSPHAATRLVAWLNVLFADAIGGLVHLAGGGVVQTAGNQKTQGPVGMAQLMAVIEYGFQAGVVARITSGQADLPAGYWRTLAAPKGLAVILAGLAPAIASSTATEPATGDSLAAQEEEKAQLQAQLAETCSHRACAYLACTNMSCASEAELGKGHHCSGCKVVSYCGVGCQRAAWKCEHKLACSRLRDVVNV